MNYNLSGKNDSDKRKYEEFIAQEEEKRTKLSEEMKQLRTSKVLLNKLDMMIGI